MRKAFTNQLLYALQTGPDIVLCVDECKATGGIIRQRMVTRHTYKEWEDDYINPRFNKRTGLTAFGIIKRNFRGKFYIFDPKDPKNTKRITNEWANKVAP